MGGDELKLSDVISTFSNFWEIFFFGGNKCNSDVNASSQRWTRDKLELSEGKFLFSCFDANFSKSSVCGSEVGGAKERERGLIQFVQTIRGRHLICRLLSCFCICMLTWRIKNQKLFPNLAANINKPLFCVLAKSCWELWEEKLRILVMFSIEIQGPASCRVASCCLW